MLAQNLEFKIAKIHRLPEGSRLKAFVDVSVNDALLIKGLRVVDGKAGLFVSMPQEQGHTSAYPALVPAAWRRTNRLYRQPHAGL